jgi:hypothetical protein
MTKQALDRSRVCACIVQSVPAINKATTCWMLGCLGERARATFIIISEVVALNESVCDYGSENCARCSDMFHCRKLSVESPD